MYLQHKAWEMVAGYESIGAIVVGTIYSGMFIWAMFTKPQDRSISNRQLSIVLMLSALVLVACTWLSYASNHNQLRKTQEAWNTTFGRWDPNQQYDPLEELTLKGTVREVYYEYGRKGGPKAIEIVDDNGHAVPTKLVLKEHHRDHGIRRNARVTVVVKAPLKLHEQGWVVEGITIHKDR